MPNPQLEDGYFRVANEWWDALVRTRIPGEQMQCLHYIIRRTYGYRKKEARLDESMFVAATGLHRGSVFRALKSLKNRKIVGCKKAAGGGAIYWFNKKYWQWKDAAKKQRAAKAPQKRCKKAAPPIKDNIKNKETNMSGTPDGEGEVEKVQKGIKSAIVRKTIEYLNKVTGKKYQWESKSAQKHIRGRISQGYNLDDFKRVIDIKSAEWLDDPRNNMYLRPETLFNETKFQGYVNQRPATKQDEVNARRKRVFGGNRRG